MKLTLTAGAATVAMFAASTIAADILFDQPRIPETDPQAEGFFSAIMAGNGDGDPDTQETVLMADDFTVGGLGWENLSVTTYMTIQGADPPNFLLQIYSNGGDGDPGSVLLEMTSANWIETGIFYGPDEMFEVTWTLDPSIVLAPGEYWLVSAGNDPPNDFSVTRWVGADNPGTINGEEIHTMSPAGDFHRPGYPTDWTPLSQAPGGPSIQWDAAFTIEGTRVVPTPGALALIGVAGLVARRRRRN